MLMADESKVAKIVEAPLKGRKSAVMVDKRHIAKSVIPPALAVMTFKRHSEKIVETPAFVLTA